MKKINDENSKDKILTTATKLFARKGFDGVSIREICKEADVNLCMISYYWGGKQELYNAIVEEMIERQTNYAKTFLDLNSNPGKMSKKEQIDLLLLILDKFVEFFYANVSSDLVVFLIKEQQKPDFIPIKKAPVINYLRRLLAVIFEKNENAREMIVRTVFILSLVNSPRILPNFSLKLLGQDDFIQEDIKIIKENVKFYVNSLLKEEKIV
mgnify:FL=1